MGPAGGAQVSAQPAGARLPRGSWCRAVLLGKSLALPSAAACWHSAVPAGTGAVAGPAPGQHNMPF